VFANGVTNTIENGRLRCDGGVKPTNGTDKHGSYNGADLSCSIAGVADPAAAGAVTVGFIPVLFTWNAYAATAMGEGKLLAKLSLPLGANNTAAADFSIHNTQPTQFAPFPAWKVEGALKTSAYLVYTIEGIMKEHRVLKKQTTGTQEGGGVKNESVVS
jgi:hypothetical protein